jgi:hypothetical protein
MRSEAGTYYYAYSCEGIDNAYSCDFISRTCPHKHSTPTEAAACVINDCTGWVRARCNGADRRLTTEEQAEVERYFLLRRTLKKESDMTSKICPKCSEEMGWVETVLILPNVNPNPSPSVDPVSTKAGLRVGAFVCPGCHLVELYQDIR